MRKNILILFILFFFSLKGYDQNLVLNADFEQFHCAPWYISSIEDCDHWSNPTMNSPDYFNNDCKENKTSAVPDLNWWGYQLPQSGNSYAGFFAYRPTNNKQEESIAEYIEAELSSPLKANEKYIIKLHVSLAECSTFALNKLEVYFSENKIKEKTVLLLKYDPQVESHVNINDTAKWVTVEETFIAKGNEQYMTIGCFNTGKKIKYSKVDHSKAIKEPRGEAYYFIDNVSVVPELTNETPISKDESAKTVSSSGNENIHSGSKATESKTIIYFDPNEHELKKHSIHLLDSISNFLLTSKDYQISINGYCDNSGEEAKNQILSEERAGSVSSYLKNKNIPSQFITSKGFAANDPIATNDNEAGKAKNRRVEIIININTPI
ncbi:MAG: OmpA family protein, partial [Bacteroidia bacterium]